MTPQEQSLLERCRAFATKLHDGPPDGHPWWTEQDDDKSAELIIAWKAEQIADFVRRERFSEAKDWSKNTISATLKQHQWRLSRLKELEKAP